MITSQLINVCLLAFCLSSMASAKEIITAPTVLEDGWPVAELSDVGFDPDALADLVALIDSNVSYPNIHAVLIEHKGRLVFEHYWPGEDGELGYVEHGPNTLHDIRSISKSVTSLLLGIALDKSAANVVHRPIDSYFPERGESFRKLNKITLHHILTMTAGLAWNETIAPYDDNNDYIQLLTSDDPLGYVLAKEVRETPGTRWNYNSGLTDLTAGIIESLTGKSLLDYAHSMFFDSLNITEFEWWRPPAWPTNSFPSAAAGLRLRARDLAKFGSLVLNNGKWQGRQIVPEAWVSTSTARHVNTVNEQNGYGYFWFHGELISGQTVITASGWGDQRIYVLPDDGLAITLFAGNYAKGDSGVGERIVGRIVRALR